MANKIQRIAVLTSGGDAPGMNAAIRAVVRTALYHKLEVYGVEDGYHGLFEGLLFPMNASSVANIVQRGGTILGSARLPQLPNDANIRSAIYQNLKQFGIDALIVCGGDGSYRGAELLHKESGLKVIGIPGTIDNDLPYTDFTIGFDTAVNTAVNCINNLRDTMSSHERVSVVEVMGRNCGDIAIYTGIAAGAEAVLVPEINKGYQEWLDYILHKLIQSHARGKHYGIILMAEGMKFKDDMDFFTADYVTRWLNKNSARLGSAADARATILGHIQRGGSPTASDRILAARLGAEAVEALLRGADCHCIGIKDNQLVTVTIEEAVHAKRVPSEKLLALCDILAM